MFHRIGDGCACGPGLEYWAKKTIIKTTKNKWVGDKNVSAQWSQLSILPMSSILLIAYDVVTLQNIDFTKKVLEQNQELF